MNVSNEAIALAQYACLRVQKLHPCCLYRLLGIGGSGAYLGHYDLDGCRFVSCMVIDGRRWRTGRREKLFACLELAGECRLFALEQPGSKLCDDPAYILFRDDGEGSFILSPAQLAILDQ